MAAGIDIRHARSCRSRAGGRCNCTPTFQAHVFDKRTGRRIRRTKRTISEAKAWRRDAMTALAYGEVAAVSPSARRVSDALDAMIAGMEAGAVLDRSGRRYRSSTVRDYRRDVERYLKPALGDLRLGEVRRADVQHLLVDPLHAQGLAGSTVRNKLDPLRVMFRRAVEDDEISRDPTDHLRLPALATKPRRVAARERAAALLDALPESERAVWACAFYAGLRVGELRALRWRHIDFDAAVIRVEASWDDVDGEQPTKTAAGERTVPLIGRLRAELARHKLATGRAGDDLCFGRTATAAFVRSTLRSRALRAWTAAGLEPLMPHEARHTCASYLAAADISPKDTQTAMGHADIRTTLNIYAKAVPGWEQRAALKLDAYLDEPEAGARHLRDSRPPSASGS